LRCASGAGANVLLLLLLLPLFASAAANIVFTDARHYSV